MHLLRFQYRLKVETAIPMRSQPSEKCLPKYDFFRNIKIPPIQVNRNYMLTGKVDHTPARSRYGCWVSSMTIWETGIPAHRTFDGTGWARWCTLLCLHYNRITSTVQKKIRPATHFMVWTSEEANRLPHIFDPGVSHQTGVNMLLERLPLPNMLTNVCLAPVTTTKVSC